MEDNNENMNYNSTENNGTENSSAANVNSGASYSQPYGNAYSQTNGAAYSQSAQQQYGQQTQQGAYGQQGQQYNQQSAYGNNFSTYYQQPQKKPKRPKKQRQPGQKGGWGALIGKCVVVAVIFGLVAGVIFTGVSYAGSTIVGKSNSSDSGSDSDSPVIYSSDSSDSVSQTATGNASDLGDVSDIVEEVMPSIVAITNVGTVSYQTFWGVQEYESESAGSGIIISQDSDYLYIVTNNHVVEGAETLTVQFSDNSTVEGEVKGTDSADDLAVVEVAISDIESDTLSEIKVITVGDSDSLKVGNAAIAIGNALGYGQSVTCGYISALGRTVTVEDSSTGTTTVYNNMIQTDTSINPGNSGGALLNASGELIGINSVKYSGDDVEGLGYAIPISDALPIIERLITREKVDDAKSAYLGIQGQDVSSDIATAYGMPEGIYIYQVMSGSAAEEAGLHQGDIITAFDGQTVASMSDLKELMTYYEAGQTVTVTVERMSNFGSYEEKDIDVTLGSQDDSAEVGR